MKNIFKTINQINRLLLFNSQIKDIPSVLSFKLDPNLISHKKIRGMRERVIKKDSERVREREGK